jgi:hypothetical protein
MKIFTMLLLLVVSCTTLIHAGEIEKEYVSLVKQGYMVIADYEKTEVEAGMIFQIHWLRIKTPAEDVWVSINGTLHNAALGKLKKDKSSVNLRKVHRLMALYLILTKKGDKDHG